LPFLLVFSLLGCGAAEESALDAGWRVVADSAGECGSIEQPFAESCYFAAGVKWLSYEAARQLCASHGAEPVSVGSEEENGFVFGLLHQANAAAWIGLRRTGAAGELRWENGAALEYTRWAKGEPNNEGGKERCTVIWGPGLGAEALRGRWNDAPCDDPGRDTVICERPR
jgi:hypothetical protein